MMKKQYMIPKTEIVEIKYSGMLAISGNFGGNADGPAMGRDLFDDEFDEEKILLGESPFNGF